MRLFGCPSGANGAASSSGSQGSDVMVTCSSRIFSPIRLPPSRLLKNERPSSAVRALSAKLQLVLVLVVVVEAAPVGVFERPRQCSDAGA
jgi:hypothetical protein